MVSSFFKRAFDKQLQHPVARYVFAVAAVVVAFGLRKLLEPLTGTGAPFVLFFGAVLVTSLVAGHRPGLLATLLSIPLGAYEFIVRAGYSPSQAVFQTCLYAIDCLAVVYFSFLIMRSRARSRELLELAPDAFFLANLDGRYIEVNQASCRMLGYEPGELVGKRILDLIRAEDAPRLASDRAAMLASGRTITSEWIVRRKNGTFLPVEVSANILADGRWQAFVRDISERKRIEKEQRLLAEAGAVLASSLDYEQVLTNVGQLVVRDLADWCIIDVVERGDRVRRQKVVTADPNKETVAAQLEQMTLDQSKPYLAKAAIERRRPFVIEQITPQDLEPFEQSPEHLQLLRAVNPQSMLGLPLMLRGQMLGALLLISSTRSRPFRDDDIPFGQALADRVTLAIENGRHFTAAVQATQLRDDMLGVVAHDLRNPLSVIVMQSAALRRRGPEPERRSQQSIDAIHRSAIRMKRLIQDLLDVTLIESEQLGLERARIHVRGLLEEAIEAQRPLAAAASLDVRLNLDPDLPDIWGDSHRLLQVLENLVGNAIKFTPAGGRITISAASVGRETLFRVADSGFGIAPNELPHVFDRFWQARKGARRGAGLGLPIARGIVKAHGGRIWVESSLGSGTSFFFTVPAVEDKPASAGIDDPLGPSRAYPIAG